LNFSPGVSESLASLPFESAWLDGEMVVADAHGVSDFQTL
jgi:bifunctional non-homologous end joining protein LigD